MSPHSALAWPLTELRCTVEFQSMRVARNVVGQAFVNAYKNEVGASEPQEDFDDRNALYSM